jgi:hypothetical protein
MTEGQKKALAISAAIVGVAAAGFAIYKSTAPEKEVVVGTLPMAEGGGRDAERGKSVGADPSGMPPEMANPTGEGKQ